MKIIFAQKSDIQTIQKIALEAWYPTYEDILSPEQSAYMLEMMYSTESLINQMDNKQHFILLYNEIVCVGFLSFEFYSHSQKKLKIHKFYLLPDAKDKGYGKYLLSFVEDIASKNQCDIITLNMNKFNTTYGFYLKMGFSKAREENIEIGGGYIMEDFVFEKDLTKKQ